MSGPGLPGQCYLPHVRTGKGHNMALSSSSAFTPSPVPHCVVNPKRLPGGGFKKNRQTAFADKIAKEIGQAGEGQGWGETKVRTLSEARLSCPSSWDSRWARFGNVSYARNASATRTLAWCPGASPCPRSPFQPNSASLPNPPSCSNALSSNIWGNSACDVLGTAQAPVPACPLAEGPQTATQPHFSLQEQSWREPAARVADLGAILTGAQPSLGKDS